MYQRRRVGIKSGGTIRISGIASSTCTYQNPATPLKSEGDIAPSSPCHATPLDVLECACMDVIVLECT